MAKSTDAWQINLAQKMASLYPAEVIVIVGSVATGLADAWSDLDLVMYWKDIMPENQRAQLLKAIGADMIEFSYYTATDDTLRLAPNRFKIEVSHQRLDTMEAIIHAVGQEHDTHPTKLTDIRAFLDGRVLKGDIIAEAWRTQIGMMSTPLKQKLVHQYLLKLTAHNLLEMIIRRDDALFARALINNWCDMVLKALMAANGLYPPARPKHLTHIGKTLGHQPENLSERIQIICNTSIGEAFEQGKILIYDTVAIIEGLGYDLSNVRDHFETTRLAQIKPLHLYIKK